MALHQPSNTRMSRMVYPSLCLSTHPSTCLVFTLQQFFLKECADALFGTPFFHGNMTDASIRALCIMSWWRLQKWKHFLCYWPFVWGIQRSSVNSLHKGQWREALMCSLICAWINGWVYNDEAGDLKCHCAHYDITVMWNLTQKHCFGGLFMALSFIRYLINFSHAWILDLIPSQPHLGPLLLLWFNLTLAWISNYIHHKVWCGIGCPFPSFKGATIEV